MASALIIGAKGIATEIINVIKPYELECTHIEDPALAKEFLTNTKVDLLLVTITLPNKNAVDFLDELKVSEDIDIEKTTVMVICPPQDSGMELKLIEKGFADIIHRPVDPSVLLSKINRHHSLNQYKSEFGRQSIDATCRLKIREHDNALKIDSVSEIDIILVSQEAPEFKAECVGQVFFDQSIDFWTIKQIPVRIDKVKRKKEGYLVYCSFIGVGEELRRQIREFSLNKQKELKKGVAS